MDPVSSSNGELFSKAAGTNGQPAALLLRLLHVNTRGETKKLQDENSVLGLNVSSVGFGPPAAGTVKAKPHPFSSPGMEQMAAVPSHRTSLSLPSGVGGPVC